MPVSTRLSMPFCLVSSIRRDSERISFSMDSIALRGIASVRAARISASSLRNAPIDCSIASGRQASIWLVIFTRYRSSEEKSGPAGTAGMAEAGIAAAGSAADGIAGAIGGALRGATGRGVELSSSFWRAAISAIAESSDTGLSGGEGR